MHRFRVESIGNGDTVLLGDAGQIHHLKDVLRLNQGDEIEVFDDGGHECVCSVDRFETAGVVLGVKTRIEEPIRRRSRLMVACALPKKGMDEVVDKLTQLGVDTIVPMLTERVVVRPGADSARNKVERWRKLAQAAAEQSHRSDVPEIGQITGINEIIAHSERFNLKLIPTLSGIRREPGDMLAGPPPPSILVLIGPEGDFTPGEVEAATNAGFIAITLGDQVLRVDTAAIALAGYLRVAGIT